MTASQPVKFFCEFCGSLVRPADKICPHCGSFFTEVRCPACQFQGPAKLFMDGCPVCGFAENKPEPAKRSGPAKKGPAGRPGNERKNWEDGYVIEDRPAKERQAMPAWTLILFGLAFVAVVVAAVLVAGGRH
jgi:hypothetical protein